MHRVYCCSPLLEARRTVVEDGANYLPQGSQHHRGLPPPLTAGARASRLFGESDFGLLRHVVGLALPTAGLHR